MPEPIRAAQIKHIRRSCEESSRVAQPRAEADGGPPGSFRSMRSLASAARSLASPPRRSGNTLAVPEAQRGSISEMTMRASENMRQMLQASVRDLGAAEVVSPTKCLPTFWV